MTLLDFDYIIAVTFSLVLLWSTLRGAACAKAMARASS